MKCRRIAIISLSIVLLFTGALFLLYNFAIVAYRTTSYDNEFRASYNRLTRTITIERLNGDGRWHIGGVESPVFIWSPDSRFLAYTATHSFGSRFASIMDTEYNNSTHVITDVAWLGLSQSADFGETHVDRLEVIEWLDNDTVRAEFSWLNYVGENISGWFIFELSSYSVIELSLWE